MPAGMVNGSLFGWESRAFISPRSDPWKNLKLPLYFFFYNSSWPSVQAFSQSFIQFLCHPPILVTLKHNCSRKPFFWKIFSLQSNKQHQSPPPPPPSQNLKYHSYSHCGIPCCYDAFTSTVVVVSMSKRFKSLTSIPPSVQRNNHDFDAH